MLGQREILNQFLHNFFTSGPFSPTEELELQAAVRGSYGSWLQADYAMSPRIADLDPPTSDRVGLRFTVRDKGQRIGRNPKTGQEVPILPRRVLVFRASNVLKLLINGTSDESGKGSLG